MKKTRIILSLAALACCLALASCEKDPLPGTDTPTPQPSTIKPMTITKDAFNFSLLVDSIEHFKTEYGGYGFTYKSSAASAIRTNDDNKDFLYLNPGTLVGPNTGSWDTRPRIYIRKSQLQHLSGNRYAFYGGIRFKDNADALHYGWVYVELTCDDNGDPIPYDQTTTLESYYETRPNTPIPIGARQ